MTDRKRKIIEILNRENDYVTVKVLANELNVSRRTIHNDLNDLICDSSSFTIEKKQGVGIRIIRDELGVNDFQISLEKVRIIEILRKLLFERRIVTVQELADDLFISPTSIMRDFIYIKREILNETTLELLSDSKGTRFVGDEEKFQKTLIAFNDFVLNLHSTNQFLIEEVYHLYPYYPKSIVDACLNLIQSLGTFRLYSVAAHYERNVFNVLLVMTYRMSEGHHMPVKQNNFKVDEVMALQNYLIAKDLLEMLAQEVSLSIQETDISGLSVYLQANRLDFNSSRLQIDDSRQSIVKRIIHRMSECLVIDLMNDEVLYQNVMVHYYHMIYRIEHEIIIRNPLLNDIKVEFRLMFDLMSLVIEEYRNEMKMNLSEDEIAFLMLHFQYAVDKKMKSKKILVVCPNGVVTSSFIVNRIRSVLPPLDIIESVSAINVEQFNLDHIDLIVSTVPLASVNKTVVIVSPLITEKDLSAINKAYQSYIVFKNENTLIEIKSLSNYINDQYIFCNQIAHSQLEIIKMVTSRLIKDGYVQEGYKESLLEREGKGGTELITGSAVPHGSMDLVNRTIVPIWINKSPVKWGKHQVKVVIFFVLAKNDLTKAKEILEDVFRIVKSKSFIDKTLLLFNESELYEFLKGGQ